MTPKYTAGVRQIEITALELKATDLKCVFLEF